MYRHEINLLKNKILYYTEMHGQQNIKNYVSIFKWDLISLQNYLQRSFMFL